MVRCPQTSRTRAPWACRLLGSPHPCQFLDEPPQRHRGRRFRCRYAHQRRRLPSSPPGSDQSCGPRTRGNSARSASVSAWNLLEESFEWEKACGSASSCVPATIATRTLLRRQARSCASADRWTTKPISSPLPPAARNPRKPPVRWSIRPRVARTICALARCRESGLTCRGDIDPHDTLVLAAALSPDQRLPLQLVEQVAGSR